MNILELEFGTQSNTFGLCASMYRAFILYCTYSTYNIQFGIINIVNYVITLDLRTSFHSVFDCSQSIDTSPIVTNRNEREQLPAIYLTCCDTNTTQFVRWWAINYVCYSVSVYHIIDRWERFRVYVTVSITRHKTNQIEPNKEFTFCIYASNHCTK